MLVSSSLQTEGENASHYWLFLDSVVTLGVHSQCWERAPSTLASIGHGVTAAELSLCSCSLYIQTVRLRQEKMPFGDPLLYNEFCPGVSKCVFVALTLKVMFYNVYTTHIFYSYRGLNNWCFEVFHLNRKIYNSIQICHSVMPYLEWLKVLFCQLFQPCTAEESSE